MIAGLKCIECGSEHLQYDSVNGEIVCTTCGIVISSDSITNAPEWRSYNSEKRRRTGAPLSYTVVDQGVSTNIDWRNIDSNGKRLNPEYRSSFYRLRKWDQILKQQGSQVRTLTYALSYITKTSYKLKLPSNVVETASVIIRKALQNGLVKGRSTENLSAASVYIACRQCEILRSLKEVSKATSISVKHLGKSYRYMVSNLNSIVPKVKSENVISKVVNSLSFSGYTERLALYLLRCVEAQRLTIGKSPASISAAALYIACFITGEKQTQTNIAKHSNVTEVTIRNRYKEIMDNVEIIITL